jgi:predicted TIM-barrel fold metal-dependent hydrolase
LLAGSAVQWQRQQLTQSWGDDVSDLQCISADSHVVEPGNLWLDYIEPAYRDRAPRLVHGPEHDSWACEGLEPLAVGLLAAAGVPADALEHGGRFDTHVPPGAWDPHARLEQIEADGVQAEVIYPTVGLTLFGMEDPGLKRACFRAYNNWVADFCAAHPDRFKAVGLLPTEDIEVAILELERCRKLGLVGGAIALDADRDQRYGEPAFEPLWAAAEGLEAPLSLHVFTGSPRSKPRRKRDIADGIVEAMWVQRALGLMVFAGVFERFPGLRIVSVESDAGWLPYFLERIDYIFERRQKLYPMKLSRELLPSEMIRRGTRFTFLRDRAAVLARHQIGLPLLLWSTDYPHNGSTWPASREVLAHIMEGVPDDERLQIVAGNTAELYGFGA